MLLGSATLAVNEDLENWRERARCRGMDINVFFPTPGDHGAVGFAKAVCEACEVRQDCLEFAHENEGSGDTTLELGIYGGLTYEERRKHWRRIRDEKRRRR